MTALRTRGGEDGGEIPSTHESWFKPLTCTGDCLSGRFCGCVPDVNAAGTSTPTPGFLDLRKSLSRIAERLGLGRRRDLANEALLLRRQSPGLAGQGERMSTLTGGCVVDPAAPLDIDLTQAVNTMPAVFRASASFPLQGEDALRP